MSDQDKDQAPTPGPAEPPAVEAPEAPLAEPEQPPPRPARSPLAGLALLLAVAVAAAAGYGGFVLWRELEAVRAEQAQAVPKSVLQARLEKLVERGELDQATRTVASERQALERELAALQQRLTELGDTQQALAEQQQNMSGRLDRVDELTESTLADWTRAEAAYLARVAIYRARFHEDPDAALAALRTADSLLARLGGEAIESRQAIHRAIDQLVAVTPPRLEALAERIEALITQVDVWPLEMQLERLVAEPQAEPETAAAADAGWRERLDHAWERFKGSLGELVIVRRNHQVEPLLAPEERYFLYHNLRLRLESARLALIDRNEALYRGSLERAAEWIRRYYATEEPEVEEALASIAELQRARLGYQVPDIAPVLEPVLKY